MIQSNPQSNPQSKSTKRPFTKKRLARILLGLAVGAALGWSLAGYHNGSALLEPQAHALDRNSDTHSDTDHALIPDNQAIWIAGHLLAGIAIVFFSGLVVGLLAGDNSKEPMEIAAKQDAHSHE